MTPSEARQRFSGARVARLATVGAAGAPHLVPVVFALEGDTIFTAVDHKPKRTTALQRLTNVAAHPTVALLADEYDDDDWDRLWWVRADGVGRVAEPGSALAVQAVGLLQARYPQYEDRAPAGPALVIAVERWTGWDG